MSSERITVVGLPGSGKTEWCKDFARSFVDKRRGVLIVDPLREIEVKGASTYHPSNRVEPAGEVEFLIKRLLINPYEKEVPISRRFQLVIFDEANRYFPNKIPLGPNAAYLNDSGRHLDLSMIFVARRIAQLNTDLPELSHRLIAFLQTGVNDIQRLNDIRSGLGDEVQTLPKYQFIELDARENRVTRHLPISIK
jgi:DNA helicase HerA-like ATPase